MTESWFAAVPFHPLPMIMESNRSPAQMSNAQVAGFSQGGAVAMMTLRAPYKLAGALGGGPPAMAALLWDIMHYR